MGPESNITGYSIGTTIVERTEVIEERIKVKTKAQRRKQPNIVLLYIDSVSRARY